MNLLGWPFLAAVLAFAALVVSGVAISWGRWPSSIAWPARIAGLLLVMVTGAGVGGVLLNRAYDFYGRLGDLVGAAGITPPRPAAAVPAVTAGLRVLQPGWQVAGEAAAARGSGLLVPTLLPGRLAHVVRHGLVYLPAAWFLNHDVRLPVIEMLHGYPGSPGNYQVQLDIATVLDREIRADRLQPVVAVFPNTYEHGRASECVNASHGQADETYLTDDVPNDVRSAFHTRTDHALALLGYSEGGFCAANLALHHPNAIAAAASLAGYFVGGTDAGTRSLYASTSALQLNSPQWEVTHLAPTGPPLLLVSGSQDASSLAQDRALAAAAAQNAPLLPLTTALVNGGAHNFATFAAALPAALDFLGNYLPSTSAPALRLPGEHVSEPPTGATPGPSATSGMRRPRARPTRRAAGPRSSDNTRTAAPSTAGTSR